MDNVQDKRLDFDEKQIVATVIKGSVGLKLSLQVSLVVLQLALLDSIDAVSSEVEHLRQAADLRWHVSDVQSLVTRLALL